MLNMNKTYHKRGEPIDGYWPIINHPNYVCWAGIKARCTNVWNPGYKNYGGRGISYCKRWEHFKNFCEDMGVRPTPEHTIERVANNGNYEPSNCKWATRSEQMLNRRVFYNSVTKVNGVHETKGRFVARFQQDGIRYKYGGTFSTIEEAEQAYKELRTKVMHGADVSSLLERPARYDSATKVKGITPHQKGGYLVRVTHNKKRIYLGWTKTFEEAKEVLETWNAQNK